MTSNPRATRADQIPVGSTYHGTVRELHGWTVTHVGYCACHACWDDDLAFLRVILNQGDRIAEVAHPSAASFTPPAT